MSGRARSTRREPAPLWTSPFRPFFLLGALYALALGAVSLGAWLGSWAAPSAAAWAALWHGHEMIFGVVGAIATGIVLTALPSWAGTAEVRGPTLALLAALWLLGRLACWSAAGDPAWLDPRWRAAVDCALFVAMLAVVAPQLARVRNRWFLLLLPILAWLAGANLVWHLGTIAGDARLAERGLRAAIHALIALFALKGGVLTPIFTGNALRASGRGQQARFSFALEAMALAALLAFAALDLCDAPPIWSGAAALACALVHGWRVARWRGWRAADVPLVIVLHVGFAWLVAAFALKAAAGLAGIVPESAWLHAFTVGAAGTMMLGLMTRVTLRHTGRPLVAPAAARWAWSTMSAAALLRLAASAHEAGAWAIALAGTLWVLPFAIWLWLFARILVAPSLPRSGAPGYLE